MRLLLAISGASGMPLAATLLRALTATSDIETHLIVSQAAESVLNYEHTSPSANSSVNHDATQDISYSANHTPIYDTANIQTALNLAHVRHDPADFAAGPASGSWQHHGMIVCPCSMATLAAIATGTGTNLIHRAADVTLKERRPLILVTRETPLSLIHLRNMLAAAQAGAVIMPPCPAFYAQPQTIQDIVDHTAGRILDQLGVQHTLGTRWRAG